MDHNKWIQIVPSEVAKKQLADERFVIAFMLESTQASLNLLLEMEISEMAASSNDSRPYTNEEKLEQMLSKNPSSAAS